jgi:hypothetical protein
VVYVGEKMETTAYIILFVGFILGYLFYELFKIRSGGVVAIPLLVIYTMYNLKIFFLILSLALLIFLLLELIFKNTAIYGRRLLYISFGTSIIITSVAVWLLKEPSPVVFLTLVPGLMAYNFHREKNSSTGLLKALVLTDIYAILVMAIAWLII